MLLQPLPTYISSTKAVIVDNLRWIGREGTVDASLCEGFYAKFSQVLKSFAFGVYNPVQETSFEQIYLM